MTTGVAAREAGEDLDAVAERGGRSCTRRSRGLALVDGEHLLDAGERDDGGRRAPSRRGGSPAMTMSAWAKAPGRSAPRSLGTSASIEQGAVLLADRRARRGRRGRDARSPRPRRSTSPTAPRARSAPSRSGTGERSRSGCTRTIVATGVPARRYSPTEALRSLTAPSIGERITVSSAAAAPDPARSAAGRSRPGDCALPRSRPDSAPPPPRSAASAESSWACAMSPAAQSSDAIAREPRASSSMARAWRTIAVCSGSTRSSVPVAPKARARTRACCSAATACSTAELKSVGSRLPRPGRCLTRVPRSTVISARRPATLVPSTT